MFALMLEYESGVVAVYCAGVSFFDGDCGVAGRSKGTRPA
jgi:hypothetical protein